MNPTTNQPDHNPTNSRRAIKPTRSNPQLHKQPTLYETRHGSGLMAKQLLRVLDQDAFQRCVVNPGMT